MMETALIGLVGVFFAAAVYLMLSRHFIRMVLGVAVLGNAVNLTILIAGRVVSTAPPIIPAGMKVPAGAIANPLPQALILTAIVISFSFLAFLLVLAFRAYQTLGTDESKAMRDVEPEGGGLPPLGY
jgi:multicomponent Na+:H+ antiporter subunit C